MKQKKINLPQKGAGRRLAERLEKLGQQKPPKSLVDKINNLLPEGREDSQNETKVCFKKATILVAFNECINLQKATLNGTF